MKIKKLMKKIGITFGVLLGIFLLFIICKIIVFRAYMLDDIRVVNGEVRYNEGITSLKRECISVNEDEEEANKITAIKGEKLFFNGKEVSVSKDIYEMNLRLYVPIEKTLEEIGVQFNRNNNIFNIEKNIIVYTGKNYYIKDGERKVLRGKILNLNGKIYVCINDLEEILNLRDRWSNDFKNIYLFTDKKYMKPKDVKNSSGKAALIRFEDVAAGGVFGSNENREKLKIMSDYLHSQGIIFHLAWVPRYVNPKDGVDNDFLKNHSMSNVQFINVLDHLINRGAIIGLHGYTHQHGNSVSTIGIELSPTINNNEKATREVAENAIRTAKTLNIPYSFFETPHYHATRKEQKVLEEYFNILYEPYAGYWNLKPIISLNNKATLYVPTPLGYVQDDDGSVMARRIVENSNGQMLSSLFIHPFKELKFIDLKSLDSNGYGDYVYKENSPLQNIVQALNKTGQVTISVDSLK